ncbi:MAG: endo alpha-1,4 polygalactosaminidase [Patescibacteria group bacterium]
MPKSQKMTKPNNIISSFNVIALLLNITILLTIVTSTRTMSKKVEAPKASVTDLTTIAATRVKNDLELVEANTPSTLIYKTLDRSDIANQSAEYVKISKGTTNWIGTEDYRNNSYLGLRFSGESIPSSSKIKSASLEVTSSLTDWELLDMNIYAENVTDPKPFERGQKFSGRAFLPASQSVSLDQKWYRNQTYSFNVTRLVQELISSGKMTNGMASFVLKGVGKPWDYYFFYSDSERGPKLKIVLDTGVVTTISTTGTQVSPTRQPSQNPTITKTIPSPTKVAASPTKTIPSPTKSATSTPSQSNPTSPPMTGDIWRPTTENPIHWHWQLTQDFDFDRDMPYLKNKKVFDIDGEKTSAETVARLHAISPDVKVICYFDAGVWESYRSDADAFPASVIGKKDEGWDGSFWLDTRQIDTLRPIMETRIKNWCKDKGFDAIEPDETENQDENEGSNITGFNITRKQTIEYNKMIAELAHKYGLSAGLKGNTTELADLVPYYEWTLNEECWQYKECKENMTAFLNYRDNGYYKNFGKAVFNIEYKATPDCTWSNANHMNSAKRDLDLQGPAHKAYSYSPCVADDVTNWP